MKRFLQCATITATLLVSGCAQMPTSKDTLASNPSLPVHLYVEEGEFKYHTAANLTMAVNPIPILALLTYATQVAMSNSFDNAHAELNAQAKRQNIANNHAANLAQEVADKLRASGRTVVIHSVPYANTVIGGGSDRLNFAPKLPDAVAQNAVSIGLRTEFGSCGSKVIAPCGRVSLFAIQAQANQKPSLSLWSSVQYPLPTPASGPSTGTGPATRFETLADAINRIADFDQALAQMVSPAAENTWRLLTGAAAP